MKYRIYVIEDDENIRNLICVALENFGYCASGFETAEEALDSLSELLRRGREAEQGIRRCLYSTGCCRGWTAWRRSAKSGRCRTFPQPRS
ncbi:MAG: hypothetical protein ACLT76_05020 [Clostridium fessum]